MSNDESIFDPAFQPSDIIRIYKLSSGDEIVGTEQGMLHNTIVISHPAKLLLSSTPDGMAHFLAPFVFDPAAPAIAVRATSVVYVQSPTHSIRQAYLQQRMAFENWQKFVAQAPHDRNLALQSANAFATNPTTLH